MPERGIWHVERSSARFRVGRSFMQLDDGGPAIHIDERCSPLPLALRGTIRLEPRTMHDSPVALDAQGRHAWRAVSTGATVTVAFDAPALSWSGTAYHDMNWGEDPLEAAFRDWTWLRAQRGGTTTVLYDVRRRDGTRLAFGRDFDGGDILDRAVPPPHALKRGFWGMPRPVLSEAKPVLKAALEDAPFYTRSRLEVTLDGRPCEAVHESLSLDRFAHPVVQRMLPFRMPLIS